MGAWPCVRLNGVFNNERDNPMRAHPKPTGRSTLLGVDRIEARREELLQCVRTALATACLLGMTLPASDASAQRTRHVHEHRHPDVVSEGGGSRPILRPTGADPRPAADPGRVSTTLDNQILVELLPGDTDSAHLFDLNGRSLVFTPDGHGGYARSVRPVAWEDDIGPPVTDGAEIPLQSFSFDFAGRRWKSFFVSRRGVITFGEPLKYQYEDAQNRFATMKQIAGSLVTAPTISPLYKPLLGGWNDDFGATLHIGVSPSRVVVTWITTEPVFYAHGVPPDAPSRFQAILSADGSIKFNYADVTFGDGIVGLFPHDDVVKGDLIASVADGADPELPGHLDLLDAAIYTSNTDAVILEFTLRDSVPDPPAGERYSIPPLFRYG